MTKPIDILELALAYSPTLKPETATSWCGPCPMCGGTDRFVVFTDEQPGWLCRGCSPDHRRSAADLLMEKEGWTYPEACERLGISTPPQVVDKWWVKIGGEWKWFPINTAYDYTDMGDKVVAQSVRYTRDGNAKNFGKRTPDASKKSGWRQGTKDVDVPPYRLSALASAISAGKTVYVVEGEKCVDFLRARGITATCNMGGTIMGKTLYTPEYCQWFQGAHVIVVADNDPPMTNPRTGEIKEAGPDHARMIAERLTGIAASVGVRLSGEWAEKKGQGLDDWLASGGDIAALPPLEPPPPPAESKSPSFPPQANDVEMGEWVAEQLRATFFWSVDQKRWYFWGGSHWEASSSEWAEQAIRTAVVGLPAAFPGNEEILKAAYKYLPVSKRKALLSECQITLQCELSKSVMPAHLLPCKNGIIDLKTGRLLPHNRDMRYTKSVPFEYNPSATAPKWQAFLDAMQPDTDVQAYLQRLAGYAATGVAEEVCAFFIGEGNNGKTTWCNVLGGVLGGYAGEIEAETLMEQRYSRRNFDLASVEGCRFVVAREMGDGTLSTGTLKTLVDIGKLHIERKNVQPYDIDRTHTLIMYANRTPRIRDTSNGTWRRMHLVRWDETVPKAQRVENYHQHLLSSDGAGILAWVVRGAMDYLSSGLQAPQSVLAATDALRESEDEIGRFLAQRCVVAPNAFAPAKELYEVYREFALAPVALRTFGTEMSRRFGATVNLRVDGRQTRCYRGVGLLSDDDGDDGEETATDATDEPPPATVSVAGTLAHPDAENEGAATDATRNVLLAGKKNNSHVVQCRSCVASVAGVEDSAAQCGKTPATDSKSSVADTVASVADVWTALGSDDLWYVWDENDKPLTRGHETRDAAEREWNEQQENSEGTGERTGKLAVGKI